MIEKIISGGQTGADRAALDFALARGIPHGGWCPRGRWAEDGIIPARYHLSETPSDDPAQRTEWNVRDADGTVIFSTSLALAGGARKTAQFTAQYHKPCLHLARDRDGETAPGKLADFVKEHRITVLNVAGPRASEDPEASEFAARTLEKATLDL